MNTRLMRNYVIKCEIKCHLDPFEKLEFELEEVSNFQILFLVLFHIFCLFLRVEYNNFLSNNLLVSDQKFSRILLQLTNIQTRSFRKIKRNFNWKNFILPFLFIFTYNIIPCPFVSLVTCDILRKKTYSMRYYF